MIKISDIYKSPEEREQKKNKKKKTRKVSKVERQDIEEIYNEALLLAKKKMDEAVRYDEIKIEAGDIKVLGKILKACKENRKKILKFFYEQTPSNYLYAHNVNVAILSLLLAMKMVYNEDQLIRVALAAFFHDMGMKNYIDIVNQDKVLKYSEKKKVEEHSNELHYIISAKSDIPKELKEEIVNISSQHHERVNGGGYPSRKNEKDIHHIAMIIAVSDVYEALTHDRPWRKAFNYCHAIEIILGGKGEEFSADIVKLLIDEITLFPVGGKVTLNDGRKAVVIKTRGDSPMRPTVKVTGDGGGNNIKDGSIIDLYRQKLLAIE
ncbi:MAG: HD domain-containing protein [Elusimicrobia bacterium]|jgi:HD-GYP domain-containing protein (c-di-GMP phosphodiesterase class II)|nr:HD domain-containing protein [Elusimicrobiota bacterium]